ncbi:MAG TPA: flagellar filament capping protein FliD [Solirubrobacteraceae bacterium]|jgi:flagellar hook-associated protein 2
MASAVNSAASAPINVTGLASGLNTSSIISALLAVERQPIARMTNEQTRIEGQRSQLLSIQSNLSQLSFVAQELGSVVLFRNSQTVSSSNPTAVGAAASAGAAIGGYELEVTQLASSAQRTFAFHSPSETDQLTVDGQQFEVAAGSNAQTLANAINSSSSATVYAAVTTGETLVLSTRATGASGPSFIQVEDPAGTLVEAPAAAKAGRNAEYTLDGVAASAATNTLTAAIPGVTLSLKALTTGGPVTVEVQPPAPSTSAVVEQVKSFVALYNSTISAIERQLTTKPPANPESAVELQTGTLFGDPQLIGVLNSMRQSIYEPPSGAPSELSSLARIGISTGRPSGAGSVSQGALEGQLQLNTGELEHALETNPAGVEQLLHSWSSSFRGVVDQQSLPGGALETRTNGDAEVIAGLSSRMAAMNETIALHQKTLQAQFAAMEAAISRSQSEGSFLSSQINSLSSSSAGSSSSSSSNLSVG